GLEAPYVHLETPNAPARVGGVAICDQSTAPGGQVTYKGTLANVESRLHLSRCFRQKLVQVPFGFDHPYWIEDADFDLEFHVRHIALPKPGDWRQLCIQVARLHARPIDLARPVWEMYVIEGLDGVEDLPAGSFAIMTKIHHAAIDGVSGNEMISAIHDLAPEGSVAAPETPWVAESAPTLMELALRSAVNNVRQPFRFARILSVAAPPAIRTYLEQREKTDTPKSEIPRTRFNGRVSPHRVVEAITLSLADVKQIRKRVDGATVNDVILSVVGGALRRYLDHHDELPNGALSAFAPISTRTPEQMKTGGNQVSGMFVRLHTDEPDAIRRLEKVYETTVSSKEITKAVGARSMTDVTQTMPGALASISGRLVARTGLMSRLSPVANCVVTNVPGPQIPLYFTGAKLVANFGLGLPMEGIGLFHCVLSYNGAISIAVTACRAQMPDPEFYAECLEASFRELREAAVE
ncbi:MAG: wax ester/triacylglycerol synthase family O-acyltransferase, partial [Proteobacteria bacterium]|nr:wax ester/triacylglycerol synthase family O-acyltransferase [Pseudomonadota bacterium]